MPRILVIDDDDQVRSMLRQMLERAGHEVLDARDGSDGLRLFRSQGADIVITDIVMPEKEGIETIRELVHEEPGVKIIAMSGGGRIGPSAYLEVAQQIGAQRTLVKPVERSEILRCIAELLA
jgi:CheY-like chemotaxis protein